MQGFFISMKPITFAGMEKTQEKIIDNAHDAFAHFLENNLPPSAELDPKLRNAISQAKVDWQGKRIDKKGKKVRLGEDRVKKILEAAAPDKYDIEILFVCRVKE